MVDRKENYKFDLGVKNQHVGYYCSAYKNHEHLKYFGKVKSVLVNHTEDWDTWANHKSTN